jgi:hypothetical protein
MAFYKKTGILPTHVYFVDTFSEASNNFLRYIFEICRTDKLENLVFILSKKIRRKDLVANPLLYKIKGLYRKARYGYDINKQNAFLVPNNCKFELIAREHWLAGEHWATSVDDVFFHYRGSLTTVLNYVAVSFPEHIIKLVGVDFNSPGYFFQEELKSLDFKWQDYTTPITTKAGMHFSAIPHEGTTMFDRFNFIVDKLSSNGNTLYSVNPNSLLVLKSFVQHSPLILET